MADSNVGINLQVKDGASGPLRAAATEAKNLGSAVDKTAGSFATISKQADSTQKELNAVNSAARNAGGGLGFFGSAASIAVGNLASMNIGGLISSVFNFGKSFIDVNIAAQNSRQRIMALVSDSAVAAGQAAGQSVTDAQTMATGTSRAFQQMQDEAEDYADRRAEIEQRLTEAMAGEDDLRAIHNAESLADMTNQHEQRVGDMRQSIAQMQDDWRYSTEQRIEGYKRELEAAVAPFKAQRNEIEKNRYTIQQQIDEERAKGAGADDDKIARLQRRLGYETSQLETVAAKEKQKVDEVTQKQVQQEARERELYQRRLDGLNASLARENASYSESMNRRLRDQAFENEQGAKADAKRIADLQKDLDDLEKQHARRVRDLNESIKTAGAASAASAKTAAREVYSEWDRMLGPNGLFANAKNQAERTDAIQKLIMKEKPTLPFTKDELEETSGLMLSYGLDVQRWLRTIADGAAGAKKPISDVTEALGTLASGDIGEAKNRILNTLKVNIYGLKTNDGKPLFDGNSQLIVPVETALATVEKSIKDRFGGAAAEASKGWDGMIARMKDAWTSFQRTAGEDPFQVLSVSLQTVLKLIEENSQRFMNFARTIGGKVAEGLAILSGGFATLAEKLGLIGKGDSMTALKALGDILYGKPSSLGNSAHIATGFIEDFNDEIGSNQNKGLTEYERKITGIAKSIDKMVKAFNDFTTWANDPATKQAWKDLTVVLSTIAKIIELWNTPGRQIDAMFVAIGNALGPIRAAPPNPDNLANIVPPGAVDYTGKPIGKPAPTPPADDIGTQSLPTAVLVKPNANRAAATATPASGGITIQNTIYAGTVVGIADLDRIIDAAVTRALDAAAARSYGRAMIGA